MEEEKHEEHSKEKQDPEADCNCGSGMKHKDCCGKMESKGESEESSSM